ncbi:hypothetical protein PIB30_023931 [Stylosanthes scabra]|uniref:Uncharacterized protein n=1 Tax=Stylosanthes scabra TaxID=79078 RepID=A0ABU6V9V2_9FABA|nr:hypothetical protein [Stylosanthes scabra]
MNSMLETIQGKSETSNIRNSDFVFTTMKCVENEVLIQKYKPDAMGISETPTITEVGCNNWISVSETAVNLKNDDEPNCHAIATRINVGPWASTKAGSIKQLWRGSLMKYETAMYMRALPFPFWTVVYLL